MVNARGMEMAIQIFIVLFVLLAVAMLVLKMVTEQTEQQIKIIGEEQRKSELKQIKVDCQSACKCESARTKVGYCLKLIESQTYGKGKMDFVENGFTRDYAEPAETGGLYGLCEDKVYCSQITSCSCGNMELSMSNCFDLICDLWKSEAADIPNLMSVYFPVPSETCGASAGDSISRHWYTIYETKMTCP